MQVKSIAECSNGSILQYFRPSLGYHFPLRSWFCLFLSGRLRQVLLYPSYYILLWDKESPPEDQNNSSETRLCKEVNFHLTNEYVLICAQGDYTMWALMRENLSSGVWEQPRRRPPCATTQSGQRLCYSLIGKYYI